MKKWRWWFMPINVTSNQPVTMLEVRDPPHMNTVPVFPGRDPIVDESEWVELERWLGRA